MVIADCESELVRDGSRGLEGGAFFEATILNRKEAKVGKGKDAIDPIKDFLKIKSDARFCQYFVKKYDLDLDKDNSPEHLRSASDEVKKAYLHTKVQEVLRDLLPQFRNSSFEDPRLLDHPLEGGRRPKYQPARENTRKETMLEPPTQIGQEVLERTVEQVQNSLPGSDVVEQNMEELSVVLSGTRSTASASILRPASVIKLWKNLRKKMIRLMMLSITTKIPSSFWTQSLVSIVCLKSMATA